MVCSCFSVFSFAVLLYWQLISFMLLIKISFSTITYFSLEAFQTHLRTNLLQWLIASPEEFSNTTSMQHLFSLFSSYFLIFSTRERQPFQDRATWELLFVLWLTIPPLWWREEHLSSSPTPNTAFCSPAPAPFTHLFLPVPGHLGHLFTQFRYGVGPSDPVDLGCCLLGCSMWSWKMGMFCKSLCNSARCCEYPFQRTWEERKEPKVH